MKKYEAYIDEWMSEDFVATIIKVIIAIINEIDPGNCKLTLVGFMRSRSFEDSTCACVRAYALKVLRISGHRPFGYHGMRDNIKRATMLGSLLNELEFKA